MAHQCHRCRYVRETTGFKQGDQRHFGERSSQWTVFSNSRSRYEAHSIHVISLLTASSVEFHTFSPGNPVKGKRIFTPPHLCNDLPRIQENINNELEWLRERLETFIGNPDPPTWVPPDYVVLNREFLTNLRLPTYRNGNPSLLFHHLDDSDDAEIKKTLGVGNQSLYAIIINHPKPSHYGM